MKVIVGGWGGIKFGWLIAGAPAPPPPPPQNPNARELRYARGGEKGGGGHTQKKLVVVKE